jgi:hypothetical protein
LSGCIIGGAGHGGLHALYLLRSSHG